MRTDSWNLRWFHLFPALQLELSETSLTSGNTSGSIEPALESPDGEASPSIAALVMAAIQQNDSRMPTAAIVLQKASELENQHQYSRQRSMCSYGFSNLQYEYVI